MGIEMWKVKHKHHAQGTQHDVVLVNDYLEVDKVILVQIAVTMGWFPVQTIGQEHNVHSHNKTLVV